MKKKIKYTTLVIFKLNKFLLFDNCEICFYTCFIKSNKNNLSNQINTIRLLIIGYGGNFIEI
jgi:hypothetical protein